MHPPPPCFLAPSHFPAFQSQARVDRVKRRLAARMTPEGEAVGFCETPQEKKPPEAFFAVEGDEEKLPEEFQNVPPRRGGAAPEEEQGGTRRDQTGAETKNEATAAATTTGGNEARSNRRLSEMVPIDSSGVRTATSDRVEAKPPSLAAGGVLSSGAGWSKGGRKHRRRYSRRRSRG